MDTPAFEILSADGVAQAQVVRLLRNWMQNHRAKGKLALYDLFDKVDFDGPNTNRQASTNAGSVAEEAIAEVPAPKIPDGVTENRQGQNADSGTENRRENSAKIETLLGGTSSPAALLGKLKTLAKNPKHKAIASDYISRFANEDIEAEATAWVNAVTVDDTKKDSNAKTNSTTTGRPYKQNADEGRSGQTGRSGQDTGAGSAAKSETGGNTKTGDREQPQAKKFSKGGVANYYRKD